MFFKDHHFGGQEPRNVTFQVVCLFDDQPLGNKGKPFFHQIDWWGNKTEKVTVDRAQKREFVSTMNEAFSNAGAVVVAHYTGLTVSDMGELRLQMREAGGTVKVAKNSLAKLALQGTEVEHMSELFTGQTVVCYSDDPVSAPKVSVGFAKSNENFVILGGAMGSDSLDVNGVKALASLPSLDELRAKIVAMVSTPATRIATVVGAPATQVARVIGAYASKSEAA